MSFLTSPCSALLERERLFANILWLGRETFVGAQSGLSWFL
jgi:hypothetical protein